MSEVKEKLRVNKNPIQIDSILDNAREKNKKVMAWILWGATKLTADLVLKVIRSQRRELVLAVVPGNEDKMKKIIGSSEKINFFIPNEKVLYQSTLKEVDGERIIVTLPEQIAQVERREQFRLFLHEYMNVKVNFMKRFSGNNIRAIDQIFEKKCYDISAGGLSFVVTKPEEKFFRKGDGIFNVELTVDDRKFIVDLTIGETLKLEPNRENKLMYAGIKVGTSFKNLSAEDRDFLENFVFNYVDLSAAIG